MGVIMLEKPTNIKQSDFKSAKWDEITAGRDFDKSDIPQLALLCQWYEVVEQCMEDIAVNGGVQVAYQNDLGDLKPLPQLSTMKQASAEIRALNKQLGINDDAQPKKQEPAKVVTLSVIQANRRAKANGRRGAKKAI